MSTIKGLEVDRRVGMALGVLPSSQRSLVERIIESPKIFAEVAALPGRVHQLANSGQLLYKLKVTQSLILIYTMIGDTVYVVDLVERATLMHFARQKSNKKRTTEKPPKVEVKNAPGVLNK